MSFAYMPLFTGDYLRDTQHLSMSEHGAFLKLLMFCWDQKGPAPLDERKLCGIVNARSGDEIEALRRVVGEFFVRMDDGLYNKRMQLEVERSESISRGRSEAGRKGYEAKAKQLPSKSKASAKHVPLSPSPSPSPSLSPSSPPDQPQPSLAASVSEISKPVAEILRRAPRAAALAQPSDVSEQVWQDFLATRKQLKAAVTQTAIDAIRREAGKARISLEDALRMCCARGWRGFKADWVRTGAAGLQARQAANTEAAYKMLFPGEVIEHEAK